MKSYTISKSEIREVLDNISKQWPKSIQIGKLKGIRVVEVENIGKLLLSEGFMAVKLDMIIIPFLQSELLRFFPSVVVDSGAVRFVVNGANIMRPGIVSLHGDFEVNSIVIISEAKYGKFLAVGIAEVDSNTAWTMNKGIVIRNIHYAGDKFWEAAKSI